VTGIKALIIFLASLVASIPAYADEVSGQWYDWSKTFQPEQPWRHAYSQTLVMKIFLCRRDSTGHVARVYLTFEQALDVIRKLDNVTLGIPKIVYLVGWQFTGHDSGYPAWNVINARLKRREDRDALQSLKWLMNEAKRYHTTVSLHINMFDAYKDSPLWDLYDKNNIILKDSSGKPIEGEVFDGVQSYQISYAQEWKLGLAQKRIDALLEILPELKEAGTIHLDAFHSVQPLRPAMQPVLQGNDRLSSPYLGLTINDEISAQRKILRYWRSRGLDVTAEDDTNHLKPDPFIGLQPMAWGFDLGHFVAFDWEHKPTIFFGLPVTLYTGTPMHAEREIRRDPKHLTGLAQEFCEKVVPWYYSNNTVAKEDGFSWTPNEYGVFVPALWRPSTIVVCVPVGMGPNFRSAMSWRLPKSWGKLAVVKVSRVTVDGLKPVRQLGVRSGVVEIPIGAGDVFAIEK
jgi:hypothetical protein